MPSVEDLDKRVDRLEAKLDRMFEAMLEALSEHTEQAKQINRLSEELSDSSETLKRVETSVTIFTSENEHVAKTLIAANATTAAELVIANKKIKHVMMALMIIVGGTPIYPVLGSLIKQLLGM